MTRLRERASGGTSVGPDRDIRPVPCVPRRSRVNDMRQRQETSGPADVPALLDQWVRADLLPPETAARILEAESGRGSRTPQRRGTPAGASVGTEALTYLGGVLILAAAVLIGARFWDEVSLPGRAGMIALAAVLLLGAGAAVPQTPAGGSAAGPGGRVRAFLWAASTVAVAALCALLAADGGGWSGAPVALSGGLGATAVGLELWRRHRSAAGLAVLVGSTAVSAGAAAALTEHDGLPGITVWTVGSAWFLAGVLRRVPNAGTAAVLGAVGAFVGADLLLGVSEAGLVLGVAAAAVVVGAAVHDADRALLVVGALGTIQLLPPMVDRWFGGVEAAGPVLLAAGALLVAAAVWISRPPAGGHRA